MIKIIIQAFILSHNKFRAAKTAGARFIFKITTHLPLITFHLFSPLFF
jgi:hypothetical protein